MTKLPYKLGLIGLGHWGKNLLRNFANLNSLSIACDTNATTLSKFQQQYPDIAFTTDQNSILTDPTISAVAIATPAATHYELVKTALLNNKDVFVEKPLAINIQNAEELVALAKQQNKLLMVGHLLQYHPAFTTLKQMINDGKIGKLQYIYSNRLNIGKLRTEENILFSFAPHDISAILSIVNEYPRDIKSFGGAYLNRDVFDTTLTTLSFKNNLKAHIFVSWLHPFKEQKLVIVGSQGMLVFDDVSDQKLLFYPHKIHWTDGKIPNVEKAEKIAIEFPQHEPLQAECSHFIDCIETRQPPKTDGKEGLAVLKVLDAAQHSLESFVKTS